MKIIMITPIETVQRSLVLRELTEAESIEVTEADLDAEIDKVVAQFGAAGSSFSAAFMTILTCVSNLRR